MPQATLDAARALLARMPAAQISVRELARAAGVSHAAPYKHFGDRHGFLVALATQCMDEFLRSQQQAVTSAGPGERLLAVGEAYVGYGAEHPYAFALIFDPEISPPGRPPAPLAPLVAAHAELLRDAVVDTVAAGRLPDHLDADVLAAALWSQAHGLTHLVIAGRIPPTQTGPILAAFLQPTAAGSPPAGQRE